jgi:hypothetical protein
MPITLLTFYADTKFKVKEHCINEKFTRWVSSAL